MGPGRQAPDLSAAACDALGYAASFSTSRSMLLDTASDAFPNSAVYAFAQWESLYGITSPTSTTTADWRAVLWAHARAQRGGNDVSIEAAVEALTGYCDVRAWTASEQYSTAMSPVSSLTSARSTRRRVFNFAVYVPLAYVTNAMLHAQVRAIVDKMRPSFQQYSVVWGAPITASYLTVEDVAGYGVEVSALEY